MSVLATIILLYIIEIIVGTIVYWNIIKRLLKTTSESFDDDKTTKNQKEED